MRAGKQVHGLALERKTSEDCEIGEDIAHMARLCHAKDLPYQTLRVSEPILEHHSMTMDQHSVEEDRHVQDDCSLAKNT
jgi:hypothetical protein